MNPPLPPNSLGRGGYPPYPKQPPLPHEDHSSATQYPPHAQQQQQHQRHHQQHNQHHPSNHHHAPYYPPPPHHHNHHQPPPYQQHRNPYPNQHQQHNHYPQHHRQPHHDPHVHPPLPGYHDAAPRHQGPPPPGYHPPQPRMASGRPAPPPPSYPMDRPQSSYNAPPPPPYHYPPPTNPGGMYQPPMPSIPPMSYVCRKCNLGGHWIHDCMKKPNQQLKQPPTKSQQSHGDWHCEPCEKHFAMKSQFDAHVLTHEACWAPGCDFSASKRVVTSHHQTAHGQYAGSGLKEIEVEGQKFHVLVGNSPEDITKWREERRKKWPSDANVKRKNDQHQDRVQAGDVTTASPSSKRQKKTPTDNSIPIKVDITHVSTRIL
ncbi:hypothetical protein, variant [Aphanomyces astaci]|uniref:C2H2-type domain-containing protein n=1 Tax=Aphanomyces astaci TaxID=112090 RepID=W4FQN8_APHAT|nr:hypothetical protein, variant [Aphanomyces astaci]ETV69109.1 hypothetical protein, variant [Aphanomyces astaci]|eukprot:XP_009841362.1 hypothetical protein, variant [Aphanomyces astaci]